MENDRDYIQIGTLQELALIREEIVKDFNYINKEVKDCIYDLDKTKAKVNNLNDIECIDCCTQLDVIRDKMTNIIETINNLLN